MGCDHGRARLWAFQLHQRLELEIERMKQIHQKELEDKDEELEDVRQSCQRRVGRCWGAQGAPSSQVSSDCCFPNPAPAQDAEPGAGAAGIPPMLGMEQGPMGTTFPVSNSSITPRAPPADSQGFVLCDNEQKIAF